ncbi:hypothetical protein N7463_007145 [Penicillium fimorum]|uniref:Uncharacterized protein n=1 Tax=Penicillium fimorum TaxID=1882269 RepID=A0A9W9XX33_9EURO|nr:hypothetical protein N7463_007145 [Penicillium fimorum]
MTQKAVEQPVPPRCAMQGPDCEKEEEETRELGVFKQTQEGRKGGGKAPTLLIASNWPATETT